MSKNVVVTVLDGENGDAPVEGATVVWGYGEVLSVSGITPTISGDGATGSDVTDSEGKLTIDPINFPLFIGVDPTAVSGFSGYNKFGALIDDTGLDDNEVALTVDQSVPDPEDVEYNWAGTGSIPDNDSGGYNNNIAVVDLPEGFVLKGVKVQVTHPWSGDLKMTLTDGTTTITLFDQPGPSPDGTYANGMDLTLKDGATALAGIATSQDVITGDWGPNQALSGLTAGNGTWSFHIEDKATYDTGTITGVTLVFGAPEAAPES